MEPQNPTVSLSLDSITDKLARLLPCDDNTCCCIPRKSTVIVISIINFLGCMMDLMSSDTCMHVYCEMRELADSLRKLLVTLFQMANLLLLLASVFENALLVDIYVWYTLGYIVMGLVVAIYEFVVKTKRDGIRSLVTFVPEVVFLFVVFRCLPLVDLYRRHLYSAAAAAPPLTTPPPGVPPTPAPTVAPPVPKK